MPRAGPPLKKPDPSEAPDKYQDAISECPTKLEEGGLNSYGKLKQHTGKGNLDRDHVPSKAAFKKRGAQVARRPLTPPENTRLENIALAIVLPKTTHKTGRTHGSKNTKAQIQLDSTDLNAAARADRAAYMKQKVPQWLLDKIDTMILSNADYDKLIKWALGLK